MQQRIVETAERLFRQYGWRKTTVADIAAELGMSTANLYRFFASKRAITQAVARKVTNDLARAVQQAVSKPELSACDRLEAFIRTSHAIIAARCIGDNRLHEMVHEAIEGSWQVIAAHKQAMRALVAGIIAEGMENGEFAPGNAEAAAVCFTYSMIVALHPVLIEHAIRDGEDVEALIGPLLQQAFRGMGAGC